MIDKRETVIATFHDLDSAREAERALRAASVSSTIALVENDQETMEGKRGSDAHGSTNHRKVSIGNFFHRLFGSDNDWDDRNETHSYFRERYAAKNHLLIVRDSSDAALSRQIMQENGGTIEERGGLLFEQELSRLDNDERVMKLHEEQLLARKERVQTGEVLVRKEIVEDTKTIEVPITREELVIKRRHLHGEALPGSIDDAEMDESDEIRIPVIEEQVQLEKQVVLTEEVVVAKRRIEDTKVVSDTVRHEEARIETKGRADVKTDTTLKDYRRDRFRKDKDDSYQPSV